MTGHLWLAIGFFALLCGCFVLGAHIGGLMSLVLAPFVWVAGAGASACFKNHLLTAGFPPRPEFSEIDHD